MSGSMWVQVMGMATMVTTVTIVATTIPGVIGTLTSVKRGANN